MRRLATAAVVMALIVVGACSSKSEGYSEDTKQTFLVSCTHNQVEPLDLCSCIYDEIAQQIPFDRYVELDKQMQNDDKFVPDELQHIAADCATRDENSNSSRSSSSDFSS